VFYFGVNVTTIIIFDHAMHNDVLTNFISRRFVEQLIAPAHKDREIYANARSLQATFVHQH
jgi:hypothetical protein